MKPTLTTSLKTRAIRTVSRFSSLPFVASCTQHLHNFRADTRGVAAIEFAFIAPVMLGMYFGLLEISMAIGADRKVSHAANIAGDLVTQGTSVDKAGIEDIMEATLAVLNVNSASLNNVTIEVSSYEMLDDGAKTRQRIGYARLGPEISRGNPVYNPADIGDRLISINSGAVVARVNFLHSPITTQFMSDVVLHETFVLKPRGPATVPFDEGGNNTFMCTFTGTDTVTCPASTT